MDPFEVAVPGAILRGDRKGDGQALVLIHGMASDRRDMDVFWDGLSEGRTLVRYDLRGFGLSRAEAGVAFDHASDIVAMLDALGIAQADLIGVSMGGGVAANVALTQPPRVRRLVLICPAIMAWQYSDEWRGQWRSVAAAMKAGDVDRARALWLQHPMFDGTRDGPFGAHLRAAVGRYEGRQWLKDDHRDVLPDIERLHQLTAPTLLVTGEHDVPDLRLIADVVEASVPDVRRIDVPGAHHLVHLDAPEVVLGAIDTFLA